MVGLEDLGCWLRLVKLVDKFGRRLRVLDLGFNNGAVLRVGRSRD